MKLSCSLTPVLHRTWPDTHHKKSITSTRIKRYTKTPWNTHYTAALMVIPRLPRRAAPCSYPRSPPATLHLTPGLPSPLASGSALSDFGDLVANIHAPAEGNMNHTIHHTTDPPTRALLACHKLTDGRLIAVTRNANITSPPSNMFPHYCWPYIIFINNDYYRSIIYGCPKNVFVLTEELGNAGNGGPRPAHDAAR